MAVAFAVLGSCAITAPAREGWQGRPLVCAPQELSPDELKVCRTWLSGVRIPDNRRVACCGEADAYVADAFRTRADGKFVAIITRDYSGVDDGEGGTTTTIPKGTEIVIPDEKINSAADDGGNPTGHGIVFMGSGGQVYCYFGPTLAFNTYPAE